MQILSSTDPKLFSFIGSTQTGSRFAVSAGAVWGCLPRSVLMVGPNQPEPWGGTAPRISEVSKPEDTICLQLLKQDLLEVGTKYWCKAKQRTLWAASNAFFISQWQLTISWHFINKTCLLCTLNVPEVGFTNDWKQHFQPRTSSSSSALSSPACCFSKDSSAAVRVQGARRRTRTLAGSPNSWISTSSGDCSVPYTFFSNQLTKHCLVLHQAWASGCFPDFSADH